MTPLAEVIPFPTSFEPYVSKRQLANYLSCSESTVKNRMRDGLPSYMIGGQRRFRLSEVESWLRERRA